MFNKGDFVKVPDDSFWDTLKGLRGEVVSVRPQTQNCTVRFTMENGHTMDFVMDFEEVEVAQP